MTPELILRVKTGSSFTNIPLFTSAEFIVSRIDGLRSGQNEISATTSPYKPGDNVQYLHILPRDIEIEIKPHNFTDFNVLFDKFSQHLGEDVRLLWNNRPTASGTVNLYIDGVMSICDMPVFDDDTRLSITIHCENPFWSGNLESLTNVASATIKGTAPPADVNIKLLSATVPTVAGNRRLHFGNWIFVAPTTDLTGDIIIIPPNTFKVDGVSHIECLKNGINVQTLGKVAVCELLSNQGTTTYNFNMSYRPQYY